MRKVIGTVYEMKTKAGGGTNAENAKETEFEPVTATASPSQIDALGIAVPAPRKDVFASSTDFNEAKDLFGRLSALVSRIALKPGGELYRQQLIRTMDKGQPGSACPALRAALGKLLSAEPYCCYCPHCQPAHGDWALPDCKACGGRGWTTRQAFEACPESDRQRILKLGGADLSSRKEGAS